MSRRNSVAVRWPFGVRSVAGLARLQGRQLTYGNLGATALDLVPVIAFRMLGLQVDHVFGYRGRADVQSGFERGTTLSPAVQATLRDLLHDAFGISLHD